MNTIKHRLESNRSLQIVGIYAAFSLLWIYFSDRILVSLVTDQVLLVQIGSFKGYLFVLITSALLYNMIARHYSSLAEAETKNASSEERLRLFFDRQIVGMAITTSEKHWLQVNDKLCSMLGYTRDELNGLSWADLTHADDLARDVAQFNRLVAGKIDDYSLEKRFIRKDGTIVATNLSVGCVRDAAGNIDYVLALLEDITDRKQVENALRESESLLRTVFDNVPFELWVRNQEGRCIMQNAALTRHWGDLLGLRPEDSPVSPEELALWQDNNRRAFAGEVVKGEVEYCINGEQRLFENVIAPIVIGGEIKSILGFNIDVTDQRKTEEKLCQAVKMESIGRLAGGIAHDFNNMLSVILGYAQMSMLKVPEGERLWQNLQEICKAAERSGEITRQLLAFSRKEVIAPQPVNLNGLVIEMEKTLGRLIGEDIALSFRQSAGLWTVLIDPSQFHQILINLAVNSRDAMPNGGSIVIETANALVDKALSQRHLEAHCGEYVLLTVRDDGTGIDSGNMEHIFEPFFTTKAVGKGTGLGLATVYGIVTQNHGFIDVDSKLGEGTSFKLYFPRLLEQSLEETKPAERILPGTGSILLVEDDEMVRWSTTQTLEEMGYTVVQAESPQAALEACRNRDLGIDAVLTDIIMPELNGFDLMKQIHAIRPGLKVLFMSGYSSDTIAERGELDVGAGFIQKPFTIYSLNLKLRALFEDRPKHHS